MSLTLAVDNKGNPEGFTYLKEQIISLTPDENLVVPGATVSTVTFFKEKTQQFREIVGGDVGLSDLCDEGTGEAATYIDHTLTIDKKLTADFSGCFLSNFTDIFWDRALMSEMMLKMQEGLNAYYKSIIDTGTPVPTPVTLTNANIFNEILRAREYFVRTNGSPANFMIADYSVERTMKSVALLSPGTGATDVYDGMNVRFTDLTLATGGMSANTAFIIGNYNFIRLQFLQPDVNSIIPGHQESGSYGSFLVRTEERSGFIDIKAALHLPFGMKLLKPTYAMKYLAV